MTALDRESKTLNGEFITHVATTRYVDERNDPEAIANCHLIAAAPALLAACEDALRDLIADGHEHYRVADALRAAIKQARGEQ